LNPGHANDGVGIPESDLEPLSLESPAATLIIHSEGEGHLKISISIKTKPVSKCDGVTTFRLFEGASHAPVPYPPTILGSTGHPVDIGDIYTHASTSTIVFGTNSKTDQAWIFCEAGLWTDVTQDLKVRNHISHPKTSKLVLWMREGSSPNYIKVDTYKRYMRM
jgi:hypothetical protein